MFFEAQSSCVSPRTPRSAGKTTALRNYRSLPACWGLSGSSGRSGWNSGHVQGSGVRAVVSEGLSAELNKPYRKDINRCVGCISRAWHGQPQDLVHQHAMNTRTQTYRRQPSQALKHAVPFVSPGCTNNRAWLRGNPRAAQKRTSPQAPVAYTATPGGRQPATSKSLQRHSLNNGGTSSMFQRGLGRVS